MTYLELKTTFSDILTRTDPTAAQITTCFTLGFARIARELRVNESEQMYNTPISAAFVRLTVPTDLKSVIGIFLAGKPVEYKTPRDFLTLDRTGAGQPSFWTRIGAFIYFDTTPDEATVVEMPYYGTIGSLVSDSDTTTLSTDSPDLLIYAALTYASKIWIDERAEQWEADYQNFLTSAQYSNDYADGPMVVQPMYAFEVTEADPC